MLVIACHDSIMGILVNIQLFDDDELKLVAPPSYQIQLHHRQYVARPIAYGP